MYWVRRAPQKYYWTIYKQIIKPSLYSIIVRIYSKNITRNTIKLYQITKESTLKLNWRLQTIT